MFPHKKGLGVQLFHGSPGPGLPLFQYDSEEPWVFARNRDGGIELKTTKNSQLEVIPAQLSSRAIMVKAQRKDLYVTGLDNLPMDVLKEIEREERGSLENHPLVYDPSESDLMDVGPLKIFPRAEIVDCCAYVTGDSKTTLSVQLLTKPYREKVELKGGIKGYVKPHSLGYGASINFQSPIKQVAIAKSSSQSYELQQYLLVRTATECTLIRVDIHKSTMELQRKCSLSVDLFGEEFAHLTFNPFDTRIFGVVGVKGKWGIVQANEKKTNYMITFLGSIFDASEFSKFKRVAWTKDQGKILVMGRKYLKIIDVLSGKSKDVISTTLWSEIRDYKQFTGDDRYSFLLTSRELIICDTQHGFKRLLSWKHNLDNEDPSLRMSVSETDELQFVFLYSLMSPIVLVFEFQIEDGVAKSLRDPFILDVDMDLQTQALFLLPVLPSDDDDIKIEDVGTELKRLWSDYSEPHDGEWFTLLWMTTELELSTMVMTTVESMMINDDDDEDEDGEVEVEQSTKTGESSVTNGIVQLMTGRGLSLSNTAYRLIPELFDENEDENEGEAEELDDSLLFQEYASRFNIVKSADSKAQSLFNITEPIQRFTSFEEFDNMLMQLKDHCNSQGVDYLDFKDIAEAVIGEKCESLDQFFGVLRDLWRDDKLSKEIVRDVGLSLSVVYDKSVEDRRLRESLESLPPKWRKIADSWDDEFNDSDDEEYARSQRSGTDTEAPVAMQPVINLTQQSQSQPQRQSQSIMRPSQRLASQRLGSQRLGSQRLDSQSQGAAVQSQGQGQGQSQKRKRKRVKGFA